LSGWVLLTAIRLLHCCFYLPKQYSITGHRWETRQSIERHL